MTDSQNRRLTTALLLASTMVLGACGDDSPAESQSSSASSSGAGAAGGDGSGAGGSGGSGATGGGGNTVQACPLGSSWSVVDDLVFSPGEPSNVEEIAAGPSGELYASGVVKAGMFRGLTRKSVDGGATWTNLEAVDPVSMKPIGASGIVVDPDGVVFMIGGGGSARVVWRSDDGGDSFSRIDEVAFSATEPCNTGTIARAADGTLYTLGSCDDTGWILRRGDNGGRTWTTLDTFELSAGHTARSGQVYVDATGRPFASGFAHDELDVNHWVVRSTDDGGTWATIDDYQLVAGAHAGASYLGGKTRLYGVGSAATALPDFTGSHWIVRGYDTGGGAWSTTDDHAPAGATSAARAVHEDPAGTLLVIGTVQAASGSVGTNVAIARLSDDEGSTWKDFDTYSYVAGKPTAPTSIASDPAGNVYVTTRGVDESDVAHWIVRKLSCD